MRITVLFFLISFAGMAQFEVTPYEATDAFEMTSMFPIVSSERNKDAAENINIVLHDRMLEKVYREEDDDRYSEIFPPEGEIYGASEFDYTIVANNENYFSIAITCAYTGAYMEYFTMYFTFDAHTGHRIFLTDIFAETPLLDLGTWVNDRIATEIEEFIAQIDTSYNEGDYYSEYGLEQYSMYSECLEWFTESDYISDDYFYMTDTSIVFVRGRCSNHMMAALDDLWDFHEAFAIHELTPMMNDNGLALLNGDKLDFGVNGIPTGKVLRGKIGGKYPITFIIRESYDGYYMGHYWYDKVGQMIDLSGELDEFARLHLVESNEDDKETGKFSLMVMSDGTLEGSWSDMEDTKELEIKLQP